MQAMTEVNQCIPLVQGPAIFNLGTLCHEFTWISELITFVLRRRKLALSTSQKMRAHSSAGVCHHHKMNQARYSRTNNSSLREQCSGVNIAFSVTIRANLSRKS